jgi:mannosyltransferase
MGGAAPRGAHRDGLLVLLLTLAALAIRLLDLGGQGLWYDEAYSVFIARLPLAQAWQALVADGVHPPLYYALLRFVLLFGDSEFAVRLPSAVAGALTIPLVYAIGQGSAGRRAGLFAAGLLVVAPFHVWQSRDARMYALLGLLWAACLLSYLSMVRRRSRAAAALFCLTHAVAYLTHYFALFLPLVEFLDLIVHLRERPRFVRWWTGLQALSVLPFLAWAFVIAQRDAQIFGIGWVPRPQLADLGWTLVNFTVGLTDSMQAWQWMAFALCLALAALAIGARWENPKSKWIVTAWALGPMLIAFLLSLRRPVYMDRFLLGCLPGLILLVAIGWSGLKGKLRVITGAMLAAALAVSLVELVFLPGAQKEQWREAAEQLRQARPGEAIVVRVLQIVVPLSYYYRGDLPLEALEVNRQVGSLEELAEGHSGVWLVYWNAAADAHRVDANPPFDPEAEANPIAARWIAGQGPRMIERIDLTGVTLIHFEGLP